MLPLEGQRVADLSSGVFGSMAAMILADYGAEVIKVEPPAGNCLRAWPGFQMWNRGKKSVVLDFESPTDVSRAVELIGTCDVAIDDSRPGRRPAELEADSLRRRHPSLVHCRLDGFGSRDLDSVLPSYEGIVTALSGRLQGLDELSGCAAPWAAERPVFLASPIGSYSTAMLAAQGILGALFARERSGRGASLSTTLLDGLTAATMRLAFRREGERVVPAEVYAASNMIRKGIALTFMTAECADGRYIQMCARTDQHFRNWMRATSLNDLAAEPRFARAPLSFESDADLEELRSRLRAAMRTKTQDEWMYLFCNVYDVGADPMLTFSEFLRHPQIVDNGFAAEVKDPDLGTVRQLGRFANLSEMPRSDLLPAPALGSNQDDLAMWCADAPSHDAPSSDLSPIDAGRTPQLPFEGVTIIELATFLAAPLGATLLAESGARVIKVEMPDGDQFRRVGLEFVHLAHGKESIAIDLKQSEGQDVLRRLVARADVVLHNMRPGAAERLGASYEDLRAVNPDIVYVYAASYGSKGAQSHRPAFHSTPHALSGGGVLQAGEGNPPVDDSYPDPCAGVAVAAAMALGLLARERTGSGQYIETSMLCSTGYVHSNELVEFDGRPPRATVDTQQRGFHALYRLYRSSSGWLFLGALIDAEWDALTDAVGHPEWRADERFATSAARLANDATLTRDLDELFAARPAKEWHDALTQRGVPCVAADEQRFEEFLVAQDFVEPVSHPHYGEYFRIRPRLRFEGVASRRGKACTKGEHSLAVLEELGFSADQCRELVESGCVVTG